MGGSRDGAWPAQLPRSPELAKDPHDSGALALVPLVSNTWYVDAQAAPPGNGSSASPYASIQYALDQPTTVHGDLLLVAPGVYVENLALSKSVRIRATGAELDETVLRAASPGAVVTSAAFEGAGGTPALEGWTIAMGWATPPASARRSRRVGFLPAARALRRARLHVRRRDPPNRVQLLRAVAPHHHRQPGRTARVRVGELRLDLAHRHIVSGNAIDATFAPDVYNCSASCVPSALLATGTHNFSGAPGFWKHAAQDYHLAPLSPCIDAGIHPALPPDPDGSVADVGAYTYDPEYAATPTTYCTPTLASQACTPVIAWSGTASLSGPDDFHLVVAPVLNQKFGLHLGRVATSSSLLWWNAVRRAAVRARLRPDFRRQPNRKRLHRRVQLALQPGLHGAEGADRRRHPLRASVGPRPRLRAAQQLAALQRDRVPDRSRRQRFQGILEREPAGTTPRLRRDRRRGESVRLCCSRASGIARTPSAKEPSGLFRSRSGWCGGSPNAGA